MDTVYSLCPKTPFLHLSQSSYSCQNRPIVPHSLEKSLVSVWCRLGSPWLELQNTTRPLTFANKNIRYLDTLRHWKMTFKCHLLGRRRIQFLLSSFLLFTAKNILDININIHQIEKIIFIKCNYAWFWFTVVPTVRVNWVLSAWHWATKVNCYAFNLKEESTLSQKITTVSVNKTYICDIFNLITFNVKPTRYLYI